MNGLRKTKSGLSLSALTQAFVCLTICLYVFSCCAGTGKASADELRVLQISACSDHLTLLLSDGTVKCYGTLPLEASETVGQWTGIRQISEGGEYLLSMSCTSFVNGDLVAHDRLYDVLNNTFYGNAGTGSFYYEGNYEYVTENVAP